MISSNFKCTAILNFFISFGSVRFLFMMPYTTERTLKCTANKKLSVQPSAAMATVTETTLHLPKIPNQ